MELDRLLPMPPLPLGIPRDDDLQYNVVATYGGGSGLKVGGTAAALIKATEVMILRPVAVKK